MPIRKPWKVVSGTLAAAVALGSTAAVAQTGNDMPDTLDLDDVVTIDQVTDATIASLFSDNPTITLDDSIASVSDDADDESTDAADDEDSTDTPSVDTPSVESPDNSTDDDSTDSVDTPSVESPDDSPDDSPDSDDSN